MVTETVLRERNIHRNYEDFLRVLLGLPRLTPEKQKRDVKLPVLPVNVVCFGCGSAFQLYPCIYRARMKQTKTARLFCSRHCYDLHRFRRNGGPHKHDYAKVYALYDKLKKINEVSYELRIPSVSVRYILSRRHLEEK